MQAENKVVRDMENVHIHDMYVCLHLISDLKNGDKLENTENGNFWQHFSIDHMAAQVNRNILQVKL